VLPLLLPPLLLIAFGSNVDPLDEPPDPPDVPPVLELPVPLPVFPPCITALPPLLIAFDPAIIPWAPFIKVEASALFRSVLPPAPKLKLTLTICLYQLVIFNSFYAFSRFKTMMRINANLPKSRNYTR
jgi:hypothetical protein